ncbi:MAG: SMI1/KNR4 family protein [Acetatifactor sp.]|nr:SMI1/KNR4 family protein [Acetatifactor sp.]
MISAELELLIAQLKENGEMRFLEAATEEQIVFFERKNEIVFPEKYKEWLQFSDGGECFLPAGVQFYGVAHKPLIDVNDNCRPNDSYIVIGALANGDPIVFEKGNEQISIYNHECNRIEDDEVYTDFFAFLNDLYEMLGIGE